MVHGHVLAAMSRQCNTSLLPCRVIATSSAYLCFCTCFHDVQSLSVCVVFFRCHPRFRSSFSIPEHRHTAMSMAHSTFMYVRVMFTYTDTHVLAHVSMCKQACTRTLSWCICACKHPDAYAPMLTFALAYAFAYVKRLRIALHESIYIFVYIWT